MAEDAGASATQHLGRGGVPLTLAIIGVSVLCGVGLIGMAYWFLTLSWDWFAAGVVPLVVGVYLLFTRVTGPDHA